MRGLDVLRACEQGSAPRDAGHPRTTACRQRQALDRLGQQLIRLLRAAQWFAAGPLASRLDSRANGVRALTGTAIELLRTWARHGDEQVETVEQRARELVAIGREACSRARALGRGIAARTARAKVHGRDELEAGRKDDLAADPRDRDRPVLERLP